MPRIVLNPPDDTQLMRQPQAKAIVVRSSALWLRAGRVRLRLGRTRRMRWKTRQFRDEAFGKLRPAVTRFAAPSRRRRRPHPGRRTSQSQRARPRERARVLEGERQRAPQLPSTAETENRGSQLGSSRSVHRRSLDEGACRSRQHDASILDELYEFTGGVSLSLGHRASAISPRRDPRPLVLIEVDDRTLR
jgi:hypothetical protein